MKPRGLTVKEAAQITGYHPEYIRRLIRQEKINAELIGQMYFIDRRSLQEYVDHMRTSDDPRAGPR